MYWKRIRWCWWLACSLLVVAGCGTAPGGKTYKVTGTVKFADGTPLTKGVINFVGDKVTALSPLQPDGSFSLATNKPNDGAPEGTYKVFFTGECMGGYQQQPLIHTKFGTVETAGIEQKVTTQKNHFDIVVDKPQETSRVAP